MDNPDGGKEKRVADKALTESLDDAKNIESDLVTAQPGNKADEAGKPAVDSDDEVDTGATAETLPSVAPAPKLSTLANDKVAKTDATKVSVGAPLGAGEASTKKARNLPANGAELTYLRANESTVDKNETTPKPPVKAHHGKKLICVLSLVATCVLLVAVSLMVGTFIGREQQADVANNNGEVNDLPTYSGINNAPETLVDNPVLASENDELALAFLKMHNDGQNSCYSPLSIRYALEMLKEATGGETRAQVEQVLGDVALKRYDNVADHLSIANSFWVLNGLENNIRSDFKETIANKFGATFHVDTFQSAANVNKWASDNTFGLIENPLSDADVEGLQAILANALAIDMNWEVEFDKDMTRDAIFGEMEAEKMYKTMHMNHNSEHLFYNFDSSATVFAADLKEYEGTRLQFMAVVPKHQDLQSYINKVTIADLNKLIAGLNKAIPANDTYRLDFNAYIPKFEMTGGSETFLQDLQNLGIKDAFSAEDADFSGMTDANGFFIDNAIHKTKIDFSEEGIKAAAVTILGGKGASGPFKPYNIITVVVAISDPFLYLIRDVDTGEIWFSGTVYEPTPAEGQE